MKILGILHFFRTKSTKNFEISEKSVRITESSKKGPSRFTSERRLENERGEIMDKNPEAFNQIAMALSRRFDSLYYVDIESGAYKEYMATSFLESVNIPKEGKDFFAESRENAKRCVHPDDLEMVTHIHDKSVMLEHLSQKPYFSAIYRLILDGKILHVRHFEIMCEDKKHILCCIENFEDEFKKQEEQERNLLSARRMARRDDLTGIRNKNAFREYIRTVDDMIKANPHDYHFGVVVCDMNDLKHINDTRGHSFGDEYIQRTSRIICNIFKHSPTFRIGGDEFVAVLNNQDYDDREKLLETLRKESLENGRSRSGPVIASGMSVYDEETDDEFMKVFKRADSAMYEDKADLKSIRVKDGFANMGKLHTPIPDERKRRLDALFDALYTVAGEGYIYLNDMRYDYSRLSLPLVDDFELGSEHLYHADKIWDERVHPDDMKIYRDAVDSLLCGTADFKLTHYRMRKSDGSYVVCKTRGFVLSDSNGDPEYFGGILVLV